MLIGDIENKICEELKFRERSSALNTFRDLASLRSLLGEIPSIHNGINNLLADFISLLSTVSSDQGPFLAGKDSLLCKAATPPAPSSPLFL